MFFFPPEYKLYTSLVKLFVSYFWCCCKWSCFLTLCLDCWFQVFWALWILTVEFKTFRNQRSSYWLVIIRSGILYSRMLLRKLYFILGFKQFVVRLWAISWSSLSYRPIVLRSSKLMTTYASCMVNVTGFQKPFQLQANDLATKMPFIHIILLFLWCQEL